MVVLIRARKELCICEIMDTLKLAQYNVSRHVKELKNAGLVQERKEGRFVFYGLIRAHATFNKHLLKALEVIVGSPVIDDDAVRLHKRLSLRKNNRCVVGIKKCA
jgi:ArsR family transcriptional regulator